MNHGQVGDMRDPVVKILLALFGLAGWVVATSCSPRAFPRDGTAEPELTLRDTLPPPAVHKFSGLERSHPAAEAAAAADPANAERLVPPLDSHVPPYASGTDCPPDSTLDDGRCTCDPGFAASSDGRSCTPGLRCPAFATPLDEDWCLCDAGYLPDPDDVGCVSEAVAGLECPAHASVVGEACACDPGFELAADGASCVPEPVLGRACASNADCAGLAGSLCLLAAAGQGLCTLSCFGQSGVCGERATCACSDAACSGALCFPGCSADADCAPGFICASYLLGDGTRAGLCAAS